MNRHGPSRALEESLGEVRTATDSLIKAARKCDADAIHESVELRGIALQRFTGLMDLHRDSLDEPDLEAIRSEHASLAEQALQAEECLDELVNSSRVAIKECSKEAKAMRGYVRATGSEPMALDLSG